MPPDPSTDFSAFQDEVFGAVMSTVKAASALASYDLEFERSSDPSFARALDDTNSRILRLASSLLKSAAAGSDLDAPALRTAEDVEDRWRDVIEIADNMLEQAVCRLCSPRMQPGNETGSLVGRCTNRFLGGLGYMSRRVHWRNQAQATRTSQRTSRAPTTPIKGSATIKNLFRKFMGIQEPAETAIVVCR